jgi:hypothetical protein
MKYAVIKCVNGNYFIDSEGFTDIKQAIVKYHGVCQTLWNAPDVVTARVMIVDEYLNCVEDYREFIHHETESVEADAE